MTITFDWGANREDFAKSGQPFRGPVRIRRQAEIEQNDRWLVSPNNGRSRFSILGQEHLEVVKSPAELVPEACVVIDDQKILAQILAHSKVSV